MNASIEQLRSPAPSDGTLRHLYEALLDRSADIVFLLDRECRLVYANACALETIRNALHITLGRSEILGMTLAELGFPDWFVAQLAAHVAEAIAGNDVVAELVFANGAGEPRTYEYRLHALDGTLPAPLVAGSARDIEDQKIDARNRLALFEAERRARAEAEASVRIRDEFLSAAAHDLRTPLTAAQGRAQLMLRQMQRQGVVDPERLRTNVEAIQAAITQMSNQIAELQDVAFLQIGRPLELSTAPADLAEMIRRSVARTQKTDDPNVSVHLTFETDPVFAVVDAVRMARVFDNLLSNALKYTPEQKIITVTMRLARESKIPGVAISVSDNGIGIPADDLPRIFQRFQRASNAGAISGIGVGLAGAQQIVHQHGGSISVTSIEGEGTTFHLWLPLHGIDMVSARIDEAAAAS